MKRPQLRTGLIVPALIVSALAALLSACSFAPVHERPAAPVAAAFPQPGADAGTPAAELPWADFLADARLKALVELALKNNRDLRIAALNVQQVRAQLGVQHADQWPTLGGGFTAGRQATGNVYTLGLQITAFELDLFGHVKNLSEAALARYLASDEGRRAVHAGLVAAVAAADLAVRADDELLALTQRTLASRNEGLRLVKLRFDGGVAAEPELRNADSLVAAARVNLAALQRQRSQDLNALVLLLGQPLPADLPPAGELAALRLADLPAGLPSEVLLQRPDVRQAEQQLVAAPGRCGECAGAAGRRTRHAGDAPGGGAVAAGAAAERGAALPRARRWHTRDAGQRGALTH